MKHYKNVARTGIVAISFLLGAAYLIMVPAEAATPGKATLISPSADTTRMPAFTWNAVPGATWYWLWVDDSTGTKIKKWYGASAAGCSSGSGTCSVTPNVELAPGTAKWWIQTWNSEGYGPRSAAMYSTVTEDTDSSGDSESSSAQTFKCEAQGEFGVMVDGTIEEGDCSFEWEERINDRERATIECEVPDGTVGPNAAGTIKALRGSTVRAVGGAGGPSPGTRFVQCNLPSPTGGDELRCEGREEVRGVGADIHPDLRNTPIVIEVVEGSGNIVLVDTTCVLE